MEKTSSGDAHELIRKLQTKGWRTADTKSDTNDKTLEELARTAHAQHSKGEPVSTIKNIEATIELDIIQLEKLWMYMGLST